MTNTTDSGKIIVETIPTKKPALPSWMTPEICKCLLCPEPVSIIETAIYSHRNKAFMHVACRDKAVAKAIEQEKANATKRDSETFQIFLVVVPKS